MSTPYLEKGRVHHLWTPQKQNNLKGHKGGGRVSQKDGGSGGGVEEDEDDKEHQVGPNLNQQHKLQELCGPPNILNIP